MRILIIRIGNIGDVLMATPLLRKVKELFPHAAVDFVTSPQAKIILENNKYINQLYIYRKYPKLIRRLKKFLFEKEIARNKYDYCFVLDFTPNYVEFAHRVTGTTTLKIGFKNAKEYLLTKVKDYSYSNHIINNTFSLLQDLSDVKILDNDYKMDFVIPDSSYKEIDLAFRCTYSNIEKFFVIHPGATNSFPCRSWSNECFSEIADFLAENNLTVFITGISSERDKIKRIVSECRYRYKITPFVNKHLYEVAYILKNAVGVLCGDTGILHLARALGVPMVSLFGPSDPLHSGPIGKGVYRIIRENFRCGPCNYFPDYNMQQKKRCMDGNITPCMQAISVLRVKQTLGEFGVRTP